MARGSKLEAVTRKGMGHVSKPGQYFDRSKCCHNDYAHCPNCHRNGCYYFGDEILGIDKPNGRYSKHTRAEILELVLEWIEERPDIRDGNRAFATRDVRVGDMGSRPAQALKWLAHVGILEWENRFQPRARNMWRVRRNAEAESQGSGE